MLSKERKRQLDTDLWIIFIVSGIILALYSVFSKEITSFVKNDSVNIAVRVLFVGGVFQFGLAGLGITIVSIIRKESFISHGLQLKGAVLSIVLSLLCCVPDFIYNFTAGNVHSWMPFYDVNTTREVLLSSFPSNVIAMIITGVAWGFFEGFNYVVIADKLNERYPSKRKWLNWGALFCAVFCILVHGVVGVTPGAIIEMLCTMFLIYGMLVVRDKTGNAWGCIAIFMVYWNAL